jgi:hypothetical protein
VGEMGRGKENTNKQTKQTNKQTTTREIKKEKKPTGEQERRKK